MNSREEEKTLEQIVSLTIQDFVKEKKKLWKYFGNESWRIRKAIEEVFIKNFESGRIEKREGYEFLYRGLKDEENVHRKNASYEVMKELYKYFAKDILSALSRESEPDTLKFLVTLVGEVGDRKAVPYLKKLVEHENPNVRFAAIESLGKIGFEESVDVLYSFLNSSNVYEVYAILEALAGIGKKGIRLKVSPIKKFIKEKLLEAPVAEYLGLTSPMAFPLVVDILSRTESDLTVRKCVEGIINIVERSKDKRKIINELRKLINSDVLDKVISAYENAPDEEITDVCRFLGYMDKEEAIIELVNNLQELDAEDETRAVYLSFCEVDFLEKIFRYKHREMLPFVIRMLGILDKKESEEWIIEEVKHGNKEVIVEGIRALAMVGGRRAMEFMIEESDRLISEVGEEGFRYVLKEITKREFKFFMGLVSRMTSPPAMYLKVVLAITKEQGVKPPKNMLKKFLSMFDHPDEDVRREMIAILEWLTPDKSLSIAERLIFDESPRVRRELTSFLRKRIKDDKRFTGLLERLLTDKDMWVRASAIEVLSEGSPERFYEMFGRFIMDQEKMVREKVLTILKDLNPEPEKLIEMFRNVDNAQEVISILSEDKEIANMLKRAGLISKKD